MICCCCFCILDFYYLCFRILTFDVILICLLCHLLHTPVNCNKTQTIGCGIVMGLIIHITFNSYCFILHFVTCALVFWLLIWFQNLVVTFVLCDMLLLVLYHTLLLLVLLVIPITFNSYCFILHFCYMCFCILTSHKISKCCC